MEHAPPAAAGMPSVTREAASAVGELSDSTFRPIHYLGNKSRLLPEIARAIDAVAPRGSVVCDLFAGTGVVSRELARQHSVMASDIQEYSKILTSAMLRPKALPDPLLDALRGEVFKRGQQLRQGAVSALFDYEENALAQAEDGHPGPLADLVESGALMTAPATPDGRSCDLRELQMSVLEVLPATGENVITRYYGGVYFGYKQAAELDALAVAARALAHPYRVVAVAALLSTASDLVCSVGNQFAQPVRLRRADGTPKVVQAAATARRRRQSPVDLFEVWVGRYSRLSPCSGNHQVHRADFRSVLATLSSDVRAIYADPPYTRDHYSRFYHVLETIALGDDPGVSTMKVGPVSRPSRAIYRVERHQSPFCIKSEVESAFEALFSAGRRLDVPLVVSYSPRSPATAARQETRLVTVERLREIARRVGLSTDVVETGRGAHSKMNAAHLNAEACDGESEVLLVATP